MIRNGSPRLSAGEVVALVAGLVVFGYLAWDEALWDPRLETPLHLIAAGALVGLAYLALRRRPLPRTSLEIPILVLLVAIGVATIASQNPGLSARSLAISLTWALLLGVALVVVHRRPTLTAVTVIVPITILALLTLAEMIGRRIGWATAGAPGLPPIRLIGESTPFGSVAVAPFVLSACFALTLLVPRRRMRLTLQAAVLAVGLPLTLLSGSRSAWLALAVAGVAMLAPALRRLRFRIRPPISPGAIAGWIVAAVAAVAVAVYAEPRLTAVSSLLYREHLWRDTLRAWSAAPVLGIGPGVMPYARQAAAPAGSFPVHQPHSHNLALGVLGDAGLVGLVAALGLVAAFIWVAGPHRSRSLRGRAASSLLIGFAVAGLFEDLTFVPGFDLLVLLLAAVALHDAGAIRWAPLRGAAGPAPIRRGSRTLTAFTVAALGLGAIALVVPTVLVDTAGIVYRVASDHAWAGEWSSAEAGYELAVRLDPWHPAGPKSLAVAADYAGDPSLALGAARRASQLNPGDAATWANLAILCQAAGDRGCALTAAGRAVAYAAVGGREVINAAIVYEKLGEHALADAAYRRSMLTTVDTTLTLSWPRRVDPGTTIPAEVNQTTGALDLLVARRMNGEAISPERYTVPAIRALAYAILGDRRAASDALAAAERMDPADVMTWDIAVLLQRHWGEDATRAAQTGAALRGGPLATGPSAPRRMVWDIASFRPYPGDGLISNAERLLPKTPWPAILEPLLPTP